MESTIVAVDPSNPLADGGGPNPKMAALRRHRVRLDSLSRTTLACTVITFFTFLGIFALIGSNGPSVSLTSAAGGASGASVALFDYASKCDTAPDGSIMPRINYCWSHDVDFETRFVQSFTLSFTMIRRISNINFLQTADVPMKLAVDWFGYTPERGYFLIHSGNVSRTARCYASQLSCEPTSVIKTVAIPVTKYHIRVYLDPVVALSLSSSPAFAGSASFSIRVMNPLFAMYELGFKAFFLTVSILALLYYSWMTGCLYCGMTCHLRTYDYLYRTFKQCSSKRRQDGHQFSSSANGEAIFDGTSFAREQSTNWVQALLIALVLFNEPLLWARYYYPNDGANLAYLSVAGQMTFLAILLAYFLVEFGLLAAYANFENTVTPCRFYAPKFFWVFVYWAMSMSVYAWIITQQQKDPLFDWAEFVYSTSFTAKSGAGPGGSEAVNAQLFFLYWSSILATLYLLYLTWLILRGCASILKFSLATRVVFSLHLLVIFSSALGISAGVIYSTEIDSALNLTYFNALFNAYILTLSWLYSPSAYVDLEAQVVDDESGQARIDGGNNGEGEDGEGEEDGESTGRSKMNDDGNKEGEGERDEASLGYGPGTPYRGDDAKTGQYNSDNDVIVKPSDVEIDTAFKKSVLAAEEEEEDLGLTLRSQRVRRLSETNASSRGEGGHAQTVLLNTTRTSKNAENVLDPKLAAVFNFTSPAAATKQQQQQQQLAASTVPSLLSVVEVVSVTSSVLDDKPISSSSSSSSSSSGLHHSSTDEFYFNEVDASASVVVAALAPHREEGVNAIEEEVKVVPSNSSTTAALTFDDLFGNISTDNTRTYKAVVVPVVDSAGFGATEPYASHVRNEPFSEDFNSGESLAGTETSIPSTIQSDVKQNSTSSTTSSSSGATAASTLSINPFDDDNEKDPFESFNDF